MLALAGRGDWDEAARAGEESSSPVARVLAAGLRHRNPAAGLAMEAAAQDELARLRRYLPLLDTVITLAPLLGLLGTVTGMIGAFGIMSQAGLNQPTAITGGVGEALVATAGGLAVAIGALVPYNFFQRRVRGDGGDHRALRDEAGTAARRGTGSPPRGGLAKARPVARVPIERRHGG